MTSNDHKNKWRFIKALVSPQLRQIFYLSVGQLLCFEMLEKTPQHFFKMPLDVKLICLQPCATSYTTQQ